MDITAEVIADFRIWPLGGQAFSSTTDFPDNLIQYALCEADTETGSKRWGTYQADCRNLKQRGLFYYAAHWLAVYYPEGLNSDVNQEARLNVATKSVGDESGLTFFPLINYINMYIVLYSPYNSLLLLITIL
jgi:hypothetical protein